MFAVQNGNNNLIVDSLLSGGSAEAQVAEQVWTVCFVCSSLSTHNSPKCICRMFPIKSGWNRRCPYLCGRQRCQRPVPCGNCPLGPWPPWHPRYSRPLPRDEGGTRGSKLRRPCKAQRGAAGAAARLRQPQARRSELIVKDFPGHVMARKPRVRGLQAT